MIRYHLKCGKPKGLPGTQKALKESGIPYRVISFSSELKCRFCDKGPRENEPLYVLEDTDVKPTA